MSAVTLSPLHTPPSLTLRRCSPLRSVCVESLSVCKDVVSGVGASGEMDPALSRALFVATMDVLAEVVREPTRDPEFYQHQDTTAAQ